jgi:hypothetical protein
MGGEGEEGVVIMVRIVISSIAGIVGGLIVLLITMRKK